MVTRPVQEKRIIYELLDNWLADTLSKTPDQAPKIFADNIYQRALSLLMCKAEGAVKPVAAENEGILRVIGAGRVIDKNHNESVTPIATASSTIDDGWRTLRIDILVSDYDMLAAPIDINDTEWDSIRIKAGGFYSFDFYGNGVKLYNATTDGNHDGTAYVTLWGSTQIQSVG